MIRKTTLASTLWTLLPSIAMGQTLAGLRIEGPDSVLENTVTVYRVFAEFDNELEYEVTLDSFLCVEPGDHADIGVFGDFRAFEISDDAVETICAYYAFGLDEEYAEIDVTIHDVLSSGHALSFDSQDDFVRIPDAQVLQPADEVTVEAWVHADSVGPGWSRVVTKGRLQTNGGFILSWQRNFDNRVQLLFSNSNESTQSVMDDVSSDTYTGQWHHVAGVYSASKGFARLYIDGVLKGQTDAIGPLDDYAGYDLLIGTDHDFDRSFFDGQIDEVRIWNVARTRCQIVSNMHRPLRGDEIGLVGYWQFDEGAGQAVADASPYGNDGTLGNNVDPGSEDPAWVLSGVDLDIPPAGPYYWSEPQLVSEVSAGEEYSASITGDALEMYIFSSRDAFAETDVYFASRESIDDPFSTPVVDTELSIPGYEQHETAGSISDDGQRIYFTRHDGHGPGELYFAEWDASFELWGTPMPMAELNLASDENSVDVSADELCLVFASNRDGFMRFWTATRVSTQEPWANLAPIDVLAEYSARASDLSSDGLTLHVAAWGPPESPGMGGEDVWRLHRATRSDSFAVPVHVPELSSNKREYDISISADGRSAFVVRERTNGGGDVYKSHLLFDEEPIPGDLDCDGNLGLRDHSVFAGCMDGPVAGARLECVDADFNSDGHVDLADYGALQNLIGEQPE